MSAASWVTTALIVAVSVLVLLAIGSACTSVAADPQDSARARQRMLAEIDDMAAATARVTGRAHFSPRVMEALGRVERHRFVPALLQSAGYRNEPLPIGAGQTISQPYIVALTTDLIDPQPHHVVLEIGTGSGYQAAVLAELVKQVYSIEIIPSLANEAAGRLTELGYRNVEVRVGDGYAGWPDKAPFDAIVVTAAAPFIPEPLVAQLKAGARMVIPVASGAGGQELTVVEKQPDGSTVRRVVLPVRFVPMTGDVGKVKR